MLFAHSQVTGRGTEKDIPAGRGRQRIFPYVQYSSKKCDPYWKAQAFNQKHLAKLICFEALFHNIGFIWGLLLSQLA